MKLPKNFFIFVKAFLLIVIVSAVVYASYNHEEKPLSVSNVTRGPSHQPPVITYDNSNSMERTTTLITAIGALITAIVGYAALNISQFKHETKFSFAEFKKEFKADVAKLQATINEFVDQKAKAEISDRLHEIEKEALQYVEGFEISCFIEGITNRTIQFTESILTHEFDCDSLQLAITRIDIRIEECRVHAQSLKFSPQMLLLFEEVRQKTTSNLRQDLLELQQEDIFNDKYSRIGVIMETFLRNFLRGVIKHYMKNEIS